MLHSQDGRQPSFGTGNGSASSGCGSLTSQRPASPSFLPPVPGSGNTALGHYGEGRKRSWMFLAQRLANIGQKISL